MKLTTAHVDGVAVLRIGEPRLTSALLGDFASTAASLIANGHTRVLVDLSPVTYLDSAAIGCLMDLYRQASNAGGVLKLAGVQKRVETMLTMAGAHHFLEFHPDEASAMSSFGG
jgi:anti-anti-sigma factor